MATGPGGQARALETQYYALEADAARRGAEVEAAHAVERARLGHYELLERELDEGVLRAAAGAEGVAAEDGTVGAGPGAGGGGKCGGAPQ